MPLQSHSLYPVAIRRQHFPKADLPHVAACQRKGQRVSHCPPSFMASLYAETGKLTLTAAKKRSRESRNA